MVEELDQLNMNKGLTTLGKTENLSDFMCVNKFRTLKIATCSDVILQINVEWSYN